MESRWTLIARPQGESSALNEATIIIIIIKEFCSGMKNIKLLSLCVDSVVGWFVSGLGLKLPQPATATKDDVQVSFGNK